MMTECKDPGIPGRTPHCHIVPVTSLAMPELDIFSRLSEVQLKRYFEPRGGLFIAETPMIIERALDFGCEPAAFLVEDLKLSTPAVQGLLERCGETMRRDDGREGPDPSGNKDSCGGPGPSGNAGDGERFGAGPGAERPGVPVYTAPLPVLTELIGFELTRGVLCAMRRPEVRASIEVLEGASRVAVLENVMNPTNLGAIFRSAAALGVEAVLLTRGCTDPLYRRCARVSMGTVFQVPWAFLEEDDYVGALRRRGFATAAMALTAHTVPIDDPRLKEAEKLAIVLGTEGEGLAQETIEACDFAVKIPMAGGVDSLNVAAASAVAFWELRKQ